MKYNRIAEDKSQLEGFSKRIEENGWDKLGVLVLQYPDEEMTWEEYKSRYGIDLEKILEVNNTASDENPFWEIDFRPSFTKIIVLSAPEDFGVLPAISVSYRISQNPNATKSLADIQFLCEDANGSYGFNIEVRGNKTIGGGEI